MKKIIFISSFLCFCFYSQNISATELNIPIAYGAPCYTFALSDELLQIHNSPAEADNYELVKPVKPYTNPVEYDLQKYEQRKNEQMQSEKHKPAKHYTPSQPETPKWWREENSFQGWGFN